MKDLLMSEMGFWSAFTILFVLVVMSWFFYKVIKLSGEKPTKNDD